MATQTGFRDRATASVRRRRGPEPTRLRVGGQFVIRCLGPDGREKWRDTAKNGVVNQGLNHILDTEFHGGTPITTWYLGLINNTPTPTLAAADTLASHAGWAESTAYTGDRKEWTEGAASSQSITNSTTVDFAINATVTIYGVFLGSVATGSSGTLWATAALSGGTQSVANGDTLQVTYTISAASG
jgi:hypothetical protein